MIEITDEVEKKVVDMTFEMSEKEKATILEYGRAHYTKEDEERDILNFAVNKMLESMLENGGPYYERDTDNDENKEDQG